MVAAWPIGKHLGAVPHGIPGAVTMLGYAWPLCFPFSWSMWGADMRWVSSCLAAAGGGSVRVPCHCGMDHPVIPDLLRNWACSIFLLLVVKLRLFITWISFYELLPLCISVFSSQSWRALGVAVMVGCWVGFSKAWGAWLQMEGRNHTNIILILFFRLGCWDKKRWTFMTEWNLSHCAAMPPLNVPANASTSFINSYITLKTDDITESDQGVWTSCFHGHNLHSDSGKGRGKKETGGGN